MVRKFHNSIDKLKPDRLEDAAYLLPAITTADLQRQCMTPAAIEQKRVTPMFLNPVLPEQISVNPAHS